MDIWGKDYRQFLFGSICKYRFKVGEAILSINIMKEITKGNTGESSYRKKTF